MIQSFIIDGNQVEIDILLEQFSMELIEVTTHSDSWAQSIPNGQQHLIIIGDVNNQRIEEKFLIIDKSNSVIKLRSLISI